MVEYLHTHTSLTSPVELTRFSRCQSVFSTYPPPKKLDEICDGKLNQSLTANVGLAKLHVDIILIMCNDGTVMQQQL